MSIHIREQLVEIALKWQERYGIAPSITSAISEIDVAMMVGMREEDYSVLMQDMTAVNKGYNFIQNNLKYQIKMNLPLENLAVKLQTLVKQETMIWMCLYGLGMILITILKKPGVGIVKNI